jgi:hypothetical protein
VEPRTSLLAALDPSKAPSSPPTHRNADSARRQVLSAVALLRAHPAPIGAQLARAMAGNLYRCSNYPEIRRAIALAARGRRRRT